MSELHFVLFYFHVFLFRPIGGMCKEASDCMPFNHKEGPRMPEHNLNGRQPTLVVAIRVVTGKAM